MTYKLCCKILHVMPMVHSTFEHSSLGRSDKHVCEKAEGHVADLNEADEVKLAITVEHHHMTCNISSNRHNRSGKSAVGWLGYEAYVLLTEAA